MPRHCHVCVHSKRRAIEQMIRAGLSLRTIGELCNLKKDAIWRHQDRHMILKATAQPISSPPSEPRPASMIEERHTEPKPMDYWSVFAEEMAHFLS